jgi:hypothetical protein
VLDRLAGVRDVGDDGPPVVGGSGECAESRWSPTADGERHAAIKVGDSAHSGSLVVDVNGTPRSELVAELVRAGVGVDRVVPRRRLEDAFLALVGENTQGGGDR